MSRHVVALLRAARHALSTNRLVDEVGFGEFGKYLVRISKSLSVAGQALVAIAWVWSSRERPVPRDPVLTSEL